MVGTGSDEHPVWTIETRLDRSRSSSFCANRVVCTQCFILSVYFIAAEFCCKVCNFPDDEIASLIALQTFSDPFSNFTGVICRTVNSIPQKIYLIGRSYLLNNYMTPGFWLLGR